MCNRSTPLFKVIKLISQVISDFANGEITQATSLFDVDITLQKYIDKNFYKTASLVAASCKSAAVFSDVETEVKDAMFLYGKHMGLAYQVVDDILDFTQSSEQLGKPQVQRSHYIVRTSCHSNYLKTLHWKHKFCQRFKLNETTIWS